MGSFVSKVSVGSSLFLWFTYPSQLLSCFPLSANFYLQFCDLDKLDKLCLFFLFASLSSHHAQFLTQVFSLGLECDSVWPCLFE